MKAFTLIIAGLALLGLTGCDMPVQGAGAGIRQAAFMDGSLSVRGPDDYCIDDRVSRGDTGFAVLETCALLADPAAVTETDGFITVQFGAADSAAVNGAEAELSGLLRTSQGAALLSEAGRGSDISVVQMERGAGFVSVFFTDRADPLIDGLERQEWRVFLDIGSHLTTVSVRGYVRSPLTSGQAQALLYATVAALRRVNNP